MAPERARETWTDERLDDFRAEVSGRFDGVDRRFDGVDRRFDRIDQRLDHVDGRIDALHRTIVTVGGGLIASIPVGAAGIAATRV